MQGTESEELEARDDGQVVGEHAGTEVYGESDWVRGFSAGFGLHFFGIPVIFFLMWCVLRFMEENPEGGTTRVWLWTLGTIGVTQVAYMAPAFFVAKYKGQPSSYRSGLIVSAIVLLLLNAALVYAFWG